MLNSKLMFQAVLAVVAFAYSVPSHAYGFPRGYLTQNGADALAAAEVSGKPLLIYFTQPDCSWCDKVEVLLDQPESRKMLSDQYHFMDIDIQRSKDNVAKALLNALKVKGTPAFGVISPAGKVVCMHYGNIRSASDLAAIHAGIQEQAKRNKEGVLGPRTGDIPGCRGRVAAADADFSVAPTKPAP
jgi:thioredoxin-related protein